MAYEIETKDGIVIRNIPDNIKPDDPSVKAKVTNARQARMAEQGATGEQLSAPGINPTEGMSTGQRFLAGTGKAFSDIGRGVGQLVGAVPQSSVDESARLDKPLMNTGAGMAGNIVGNVAALAPTMMIPGANTMAGATIGGGLLGAAQPVETGQSRAQNIGTGALGGALGQGAANVIGRVIRPVQSQLTPEVSALASKAENVYGIPLTAADKTGSRPLKIIESVLDQLPLTADRQALAKELQRSAFNKAALETIGESSTKATPEVLNAARTRIGESFNDLSGRNTVTLADDFLDSLISIESGINPFTKPAVREAIDKGLELATQKTISGKDYQKIRSTLGKQGNDAFASGNSELGQALKSLKAGLDDAATGSVSAADKDAWNLARKQWQALKVVEKAAAPTSADAVAGNVSPAKLAQALMSVDKKGFTYGTSNQTLGDIARIGQAFVKEQIPNSGTAQRSFYQKLMNNPITAVMEGGVGGLSVPMQRIMQSKAGQAYLGQGPVSARTLALARKLREGAGIVGGAALPGYVEQ